MPLSSQERRARAVAPVNLSNGARGWRLLASPVESAYHLRHSGNSWAAEAGATLRELMDRMERASTARHPITSTRAATATTVSPGRCQN
jgi:hypothetical protein